MGYLYALISSFFLGITPVLAKFVILAGFSPLVVPISRFIMLSLLGVCFFLLRKNLQPIKINTLPYLLLFTLGTIMVSYGYLVAVSYIAVSQAAIIFYSFPLIIFAYMLFRRQIAWNFWVIGIFIIAFLGLFLLNFPLDATFNLIGFLLAFCASFGAIFQFMTARFLTTHYTKYELVFLVNIIGLPLSLIALFIFSHHIVLVNDLWAVLAIFAGNLLYLVGYFFLYATLKHLRPDIAGLMFNFEPLTSIIFAFLIFSEIMQLHQIIGGIFIIFAVSIIRFFAQNPNAQDHKKS